MKILIISILLFFAYAPSLIAAGITFESVSSTNAGEDMVIRVLFDPQAEIVNALEGSISITGTDFLVSDIQTGDSIISLWVEEPSVQQRMSDSVTIKFTGIIPGGFAGVVNYDGSMLPGTIMTITLRPRVAGELLVAVPLLQALRHDGRGTEIVVQKASHRITIDPSREGAPVAQKPTVVDTTPPQFMTVQLLEETELFEGSPTLIVDVRDSESGVAYIEAQFGSSEFVRITSPYQVPATLSAGEIITVKAVDKAGNSAETSLPYALQSSQTTESELSKNPFFILWGLGVFIVLILGLYRFWRSYQ